MNYLFEEINVLTSPYEAFLAGTKHGGFPIKAHWHYYMEIIFILKGTSLINCNNREYILEPGDLILFHPQAVHSIFSASSEPLKYGVLKFDINNLHINSNYTPKLGSIFKCAIDDPCAPILLPSRLFKNSLESLFNSCIEEVIIKDYGYDIHFQSLVSSLLIEILRIWRKNGFDTNNITLMPYDTDSLHTILQYIDEHSHESIKVEDLAEKCHMSYSYFAKKFHELYGQSCKDYIEFIRLSKVKDLLLFTNFDLNYISQETGFADCSHLIRTFKKKTGITPKQFRIRHNAKVL
ncbi:AraC family transcriptional regulator [Clostridium chromiireducens]|uniref:AraC family transcriptional regulator n=1 Tax=Clostridium chromiireducens TaxID=225345 RepID=A0A399IW54_9CLOT|nr:AraC family transcriptional regulator [Clostridium chromiireducens]RII36469.1 AraC family transcriptional regulator [Clostridium chromiireducens]